MWLRVLVDADPDEAERVTREQGEAGQAFLEQGLRDGWIKLALPYPETGGIMIVEVADMGEFRDRMSTYPLRDTISLDIREVLPRLSDGFAVLFANIEAARASTAVGDEGHDRAGVDQQIEQVSN